MKIYYEDDFCKIYHGDCFDIMPNLPMVDCILADPPYMIGAVSIGDPKAKNGSWADLMNSAYWYAELLRKSKSLVGDDGFISLFGNWRSIPTYTKAFVDAGIVPTSCIVWDKEWIGPASKRQFRPIYEIIYVCALEKAVIQNRSLSDIMRCKWQAGQTKITPHPAEKPVSLLIDLITAFDSQTILDPFMGSGSTLRAAKDLGKKAIGIEVEEKWCEVAANRLLQGSLPLGLHNPAINRKSGASLPLQVGL